MPERRRQGRPHTQIHEPRELNRVFTLGHFPAFPLYFFFSASPYL